ncbi:helix-turn-helix domain-containing protein [Leifsonia sp. YAF41]|uniref:AraC-like ligand-binding domain-containing protein n=1 Tax=Leifsonia sp. YAF41 TaxID=3233086 RepID=UPI003F97833C
MQRSLAAPTPRATDNRASNPKPLTFNEFRTAVSESFVPLKVTASASETASFRGVLRSVSVGDVHISEVSAARHSVERTPELIARGGVGDSFKISLQLKGTGLLIQDNREAVLRPGDLAVYDTHRPYSLVFDEAYRSMVIMFPKHLVNLPADAVGQLTAVRMSGSDGIGAIIVPFLAQLVENFDQLNGSTGAQLSQSALDLVSTMFSRELAIDRGPTTPHQALMQRIRTYIDDNLASVDLDPAQIAAAHFISTRHLHGLFHENGCTVSSLIRSRRLQQCHRDLLNPALADRPVAAIAARWGFVDAAHFSRVFKAAHGLPPSEVRSRAFSPAS